MRLINKTKNIILAEDIFMANSLFRRIKGLLGTKNLLPNQGIILEPCNSVHTFFMHFAIGVIFVDKNYKVIKVLTKLAPNRITPIYWHSSRVIELPAGTPNIVSTQAQDQLQLLD